MRTIFFSWGGRSNPMKEIGIKICPTSLAVNLLHFGESGLIYWFFLMRHTVKFKNILSKKCTILFWEGRNSVLWCLQSFFSAKLALFFKNYKLSCVNLKCLFEQWNFLMHLNFFFHFSWADANKIGFGERERKKV